MRGVKPRQYMKAVRARGNVYGYFDTGQKDGKGRRIYAPLGRIDAPEFAGRYSACLGHRTRREQVNSLLTVPRLVDMYQKGEKYKKLKPTSKRIYDIYLRAFSEALPTAPAGLLERRDILALIDARGSTPGAANVMLGAIGAVYWWARDRGHVTNDPCKDIGLLDLGEHEPWPEWLVEAALVCDKPRVRLAVHLLYYTAQRIGDVLKMRWSDIRDGAIFVTQTKTNKALELQLHSKLVKELATVTKTGLTIIAKPDGGKLSEGTLRREIQAWAKTHGQDIVPHGLRKNAINALLECECSIPEAAAISGQGFDMVEHYAKRRAQRKLGNAAILKWERKK